MNIKVLRKEFTKNGFRFKQIKRENNIAIYEQYDIKGENVVAYEVIIIVTRKVSGTFMDFKTYEGYDMVEYYPSTSQFGSLGWSIGGKDKLERANKMFNDLVLKYK